MVEMVVRHQDDIGFREVAVVDDTLFLLAHRVDLNLFAIEFDAEAGVGQGVELHGFPVGSDEGVDLVRGGILLPASRHEA